ncbi:MAG: hypothetical protein KIS94_12785 [Chitinophagales bacterium]|nr:hypothetical protein [Chitinophagales bacterium]
MIPLLIPGFKNDLQLEHLVVDFNGTLAIEGKLISGVKELLTGISKKLQVHVVTSDTFGTAKEQLKDIPCKVTIVEEANQDFQKGKYVAGLGSDSVISIGNGNNDRSMLQLSAIGITVIQSEGAATASITAGNLVCNSIKDALLLIEHPKQLIATLKS